ncbi:hypothetical protein D9757_012258 [Collybiopsis confluens]|uniref:Protein kinase domain-containing protein n=1 Tax=Collybiopsis confluens TaxID=2823264 RepID=A0A8H5G5U5_9AGAR|nr:hypothetical protein D9757_012258 [Collybiopsis confluens]
MDFPSAAQSDPKTPEKQTSALQEVKATPYSQFAGSHREGLDDAVPAKVADINQHLMGDIKETVEILVEEFAEAILGMKKDDYVLGLNEAEIAPIYEGFRDLSRAMETASGEKGIYHQIAKLLNRISMQRKEDANDEEDMTNSGDGKVFSVQDPYKIQGYLVGLSPDIVAVYRRVLKINKVKDLEVLIRDFEFSEGMRWALLLWFVEVKWENGRILGEEQYEFSVELPDLPKDPFQPVPESLEQGSSNIVSQPQSKRKRTVSTAVASSSKRSNTQEASGRRVTRQMSKNSQQASGSGIGPTDPPGDPGDEPEVPEVPAENSPANQKELALQCARYAKAALSKGQVRSHTIGMVLRANPTEVLFGMHYYDRSCLIKSKPVSLTNSTFKSVFIAMTRRIVNFSQEQLGVIRHFDHSTSFPQQLVPTRRKAAQAVQGEPTSQNGERESKAKDEEGNSDERDDSDPFAGKKFPSSFPQQLVPTKRKAAQAVEGETKSQNAKRKLKAKDEEDNSDERDDSDPFAGKKFPSSFPQQPTSRKAAQAVQGETKSQNAERKLKAKDEEDNSDERDDSDPCAGKKFSLVCTDGAERHFAVESTIYQADGIIGRGSSVFLVECEAEDDRQSESRVAPSSSWEGKKFVVKFSFPSETRDPEDALVNHARNIAKGGHAWATNHLPLLYDCLTFPFGPGTVQYRLKEFFNKRKESYEVRVLRITISEELCSLDDLKTPEEAAQVFYDILQGKSSSYTGFLYLTLAVVHRWLYTEANILHRDLSMGNIMFRRVGGKVYGVLNDFDLSSFLPLRDEPSSKWRTGTRPYMSRDLLAEGWCGGPLYRHDLESLFYIMLILCCHYKSPDKALPFKDWPYKMWFTSDDATVAKDKGDFIGWTQSAFPLQSHFERFRKWLVAIYRCFFLGYSHRERQAVLGDPINNEEQETLAGHVTYATMDELMCSFDGTNLQRRWPS